jgi:hypothetical protein
VDVEEAATTLATREETMAAVEAISTVEEAKEETVLTAVEAKIPVNLATKAIVEEEEEALTVAEEEEALTVAEEEEALTVAEEEEEEALTVAEEEEALTVAEEEEALTVVERGEACKVAVVEAEAKNPWIPPGRCVTTAPSKSLATKVSSKLSTHLLRTVIALASFRMSLKSACLLNRSLLGV